MFDVDQQFLTTFERHGLVCKEYVIGYGLLRELYDELSCHTK